MKFSDSAWGSGYSTFGGLVSGSLWDNFRSMEGMGLPVEDLNPRSRVGNL